MEMRGEKVMFYEGIDSRGSTGERGKWGMESEK